MTHSFYLKEPQGRTGSKPSLILFTCYFKKENKKFVYSTGEKISPINWNFKLNQPKSKGKVKANNATTLKTQLDRYSNTFEECQSLQIKIREEFTSKGLKTFFDRIFKKSGNKKNIFFDAYDQFIEDKLKRNDWKHSTHKRYKNIKNILLNFQRDRSYIITFSSLDNKFYTEFTNYCYTDLDHNTNTYSRNIGLIKCFMHWAYREKFTYNDAFRDFKRPNRVETSEVALTIEHLNKILTLINLPKRLIHARDIFIFQCLTGLRFGELKSLNKTSIKNKTISLNEEKDIFKPTRRIPLNDISYGILKKYNYNLPLISNQKQNEFIKEVFKEAEYTELVNHTRTKNRVKEISSAPLYNRISSHTARRTFITLMKKKGVADKTIMEMTGHKNIITLNTYYKVDDMEKKDAVQGVFANLIT